MSYVYLKTDKALWTVGFYRPDGSWVPERDCDSAEEAAHRVHYLNGGPTFNPSLTLKEPVKAPEVRTQKRGKRAKIKQNQ